MFYAILFLAELLFLFLLSRTLTRSLSYLLYHLTRSEHMTIQIMAFLFFPGTAVHELAHAVMAGVLGVPVGHMEFMPKIEGNRVKLGSVQVAHTDFFRRFLIGAAPFFTGTLILLGILYFAAQNNLFENYLIVLLIGYVVFEIGNTMFSSKKDMEGALELFGTIIVITIILYFLGVRLPAIDPNAFFNQPLVQEILQKGCLFLAVPIAIDIAVITILKLIKRR